MVVQVLREETCTLGTNAHHPNPRGPFPCVYFSVLLKCPSLWFMNKG